MKSPEQHHEETIALLGVYALDAVDDAERRLVEAHLAECECCTEEVAQHHNVVAVMSGDGVTPPAGLWDRVAGELDAAPPPLRLVPVAKASVSSFGGGRLGQILTATIATAAAITAVVGLSMVRDANKLDSVEERLASGSVRQAALAADDDPKNRHLSLVSADGQYFVDAVMANPRQGFVTNGKLPELSDTEAYQLWGLSKGQSVSLGLLSRGLEPTAFVMPEGLDGLAVTAEKSTGAVVPSKPPLVLITRRT